MTNLRQQSNRDLLEATKDLVCALQDNPQVLDKIKTVMSMPKPVSLVVDNKKPNHLNYGLMSLLIAFFVKVFH